MTAVACAALATLATAAESLNGTWDLLSKDTPHGDLHFQATFTEGPGTELSAKVLMFDNEIVMRGQRKAETFSVSGDAHGSTMSLSGKVKADGTLEGYLSNERGDLVFTGARAKK